MLLLFYAVVLMIPMKILKDYWKKKCIHTIYMDDQDHHTKIDVFVNLA